MKKLYFLFVACLLIALSSRNIQAYGQKLHTINGTAKIEQISAPKGEVQVKSPTEQPF